jgi:hypothetical protein
VSRDLHDSVDAVHADVIALARELAELRAEAQAPRDRVEFPRIPGLQRSAGEEVDVGAALAATLRAVSAASGRLARQGVTLGGEPLSMQLVGELVGMSPEEGRILITVSPRGKEKADGQSK